MSVKLQAIIQTTMAYRCKVRLGDNTGSRVEAELHLTDLSVYVFHEPEKLIRKDSRISGSPTAAKVTHWMMKSTILCFSIDSVWALVMRNEIS